MRLLEADDEANSLLLYLARIAQRRGQLSPHEPAIDARSVR